MNLCEYGCEREANHLLKNGKLCCEDKWQSCPGIRQKIKDAREGKKRTKISYPEHKKWKSEVLERDGNKCQICDGIKDLDVYHIYNIDDFPQLALDPDYGITLCPKHRRSLKKR